MSTKNVLPDLLRYGLVAEGDELHFAFKNSEFKASLLPGGILSRCTWQRGGEEKAVFMDRAGFTSLTDWCDSCIQELLSEYVTRFSSWKRVKHKRTGAPMSMLRARINELRPDTGSADTIESLQRDLLRERRRNVYLEERLRLLETAKQAPCTVMADDNPFRLQF